MAASHTLRNLGQELAVEVWVEARRNQALLRVDGREAQSRDTGAVGKVTLDHGDHHVRVTWRGLGKVHRCVLVEKGESPGTKEHLVVAFRPPEGTTAARLYAFQENHPRLYAARHVAAQTAIVVATVLGTSAILRALLPRIDLDWISMPDLDPPEWLRHLDPVTWLLRLLPQWDLLGWLPDLPDLPDVGWLQYLTPIVIACAVAAGEVRRRRQREERERALAAAEPEKDTAGKPTDRDAYA